LVVGACVSPKSACVSQLGDRACVGLDSACVGPIWFG